MLQVYIINGHGGAGKDQFIEYVSDYIGSSHVLNISTVDRVKEVASSLGWSGNKDKESRKYLSDLKDMMTYWADTPFKDVTRRTRFQFYEWEEHCIKNGVIFIHAREPEAITRLVEELNAKTLLIRRETNEEFINHADLNIEEYNYDEIINNNGTLDDLRLKAIRFVDKIKAEG